MKLDPSCTIKGDLVRITGHQSFSTSIRSTFANFGNISQISQPTHIKQLITDFTIADFEQQMRNLTELHQMLNQIEIASLPNKYSVQSHVSIIVSCTALICSIIFICIAFYWHRTKKQRNDKPTPAPRRLSAADFTINV